LVRLARGVLGAQQGEREGGIRGGVLARRGVQAVRYRAHVRGWLGQRTRKSDVRQAETIGPWGRSRQSATGGPWSRVRSVGPQASMASGVCASWQHARLAEAAGWRPPAGVASAQSIPPKAAKVACAVCVRRQLPAGVRVATRDRRADVRRRHAREPVARQPLRMRCRPPAHPQRRRYVRTQRVLGLA
jgi:hypothetical protein